MPTEFPHPVAFDRPWRITRTDGGHFKVSDANGRALAYVYVRDEPALQSEYLGPQEALEMAKAIARLSKSEFPQAE